jgi:PilX N-terminal
MMALAMQNGNGERLMKHNHETGSALVFALILMLVLSAMAGSLVFLSQSETWSSMNYRMMTQARYGAEAGVTATANFLMSANYVPPAAPAGGNFPGFNTAVYPVTDGGGNPIFLSTLSTQAPTYPNQQMQAAFANAMNANQPLQAGANNINYSASAQLMSMVSIMPFGTTQPVTIQTWQITAHGDITNVRNAEAEVVTTLERYISPAFAYAAFADANGCSSLSFTGNGTTNGYDSGALPVVGGAVQAPTAANMLGYGGNVGTNGNETDSGNNAQVNGTLSSPNAGFGVCTAGNVTAFSGKNLNQVTGGLIQLPQAVNFPTPAIPPPGTANINNTATLGPTVDPANCPTSTTCNYGDINLSGGKIVTLYPGTYNINSLSITGNAQLVLAPYPPGTPNAGQYGPIVINVTGNNNATPIDLEGNGISNPTYDPSILQFCYAGSGAMKIAGNGASAAVVYAPNATASFKGNGTFYGSVIANQLTDVGNGAIYYDMKLKKKLYTVGNYVLNSFTWDKY